MPSTYEDVVTAFENNDRFANHSFADHFDRFAGDNSMCWIEATKRMPKDSGVSVGQWMNSFKSKKELVAALRKRP